MSQSDDEDHLRSGHAHGSRLDRGSLHLAGRACASELGPGAALTLHIRRAGHLQVRGERLWLTLWLAAGDSSVRGGDHFIDPGQHIALRPHQSVVIEPCAPSGQTCRRAQFQWQPDLSPAAAWRQALAGALRALADRIAQPALLSVT